MPCACFLRLGWGSGCSHLPTFAKKTSAPFSMSATPRRLRHQAEAAKMPTESPTYLERSLTISPPPPEFSKTRDPPQKKWVYRYILPQDPRSKTKKIHLVKPRGFQAPHSNFFRFLRRSSSSAGSWSRSLQNRIPNNRVPRLRVFLRNNRVPTNKHPAQRLAIYRGY